MYKPPELPEALAAALQDYVSAAENDSEAIDRCNAVAVQMGELNPVRGPVKAVLWVPIENVSPNDYNPNSVATRELQLLHLSISKDGYTQPVVTATDDEGYVIVDGFHRYFTCKNNDDIRADTHDRLPVVVMSDGIGDRMEATVRHNRARGRHSVDGMANMVFELLGEGYSEEEVMNRLGMEASEVARLKHTTGFSKLLEDHEYSRALLTRRQIMAAKEHGEKPL